MPEKMEERVEVKILRTFADHVLELIECDHPRALRTRYREIHPDQVAEMVSWVIGTQRVSFTWDSKMMGNSAAMRTMRNGLYQYVQDEFPGGMLNFLEVHPFE